MPEKTCSTCQCNKVCDHNKYGFENCGNYISADVVPREEADRLRHILDSYALQYGTVKDQHVVIERIKKETAMEIFVEVEKALDKNKFKGVSCFLNDFAELKKKYTEG